jgi:hypothetical protein
MLNNMLGRPPRYRYIKTALFISTWISLPDLLGDVHYILSSTDENRYDLGIAVRGPYPWINPASATPLVAIC